jgi:hypothetical protein
VSIDPYSERALVQIVEATPTRAVSEQPGVRELDNHLAIRHASALYTAMYAASRALVIAAAGEGARLTESVTTYPAVPVGLITSVAEWDGDPGDGRTVVTASNADGRTVGTLAATWAV